MANLKLYTILLLSALSLFQCDASDPDVYKTESLGNSLGYFYERVGKLKLYNDNWKILVHLDLQDFIEQFHRTVSLKDKICQLCENLKSNFGCTNFLPQIEQITISLQAQNRLISHILGSKANLINKRGLFDAVGKLSKVLFGTLDEDDAKLYDEQIETLYQNQDHLQNLVKEQLTVKESMVDHINQTVQYIKELDNKLTKAIFNINKFKENVNNNSMLTQKISTIDEVFVIFVSITDQLSIVQTHLVEILTYAIEGKLHPYVIDSKNLIEEIFKIKIHLTSDTDLPITPSVNNINRLYKILDVNVYYSNKKLNFLLKLPIVKILEFEIYKITSIPRKIKDNAYEVFVPEKPFLIIDTARQHYFTYELQEIKDCREVSQGNYICEQTIPIYITSTDNNCERSLFDPVAAAPQTCSSRLIIINKPIFLQLATPNSWIYVVPTKEIISFQCKSKTVQESIHGIGKLEIRKDCQARSANIILSTKTESFQSITIEKFFTSVNRTKIEISDHYLSILEENIESSNSTHTYGIQNQIQNLKRLSLEISKIQNKIVPITKIKKHCNSITILLNSTVFISFIILIFVIYKCVYLKFNKCKRQESNLHETSKPSRTKKQRKEKLKTEKQSCEIETQS